MGHLPIAPGAAAQLQPAAPRSARVRAVMTGNRRVDTKPEVQLRRALHRAGLRYRVDVPVRVPGCKVRPDIVFTRYRLAVFVDGCFWHGCPQHFVPSKTSTEYWSSKLEHNITRDTLVTEALNRDGWHVLRIWSHVPIEDAVCMVRDALYEAKLASSLAFD